MILTFLEGTGKAKRLTKTFTRCADGTLVKSAYPNARRVTSYTTVVDTPDEFAQALRVNAIEGRALFTSSLVKPLVREARSGMAKDEQKTSWMCLDLDNAPYRTVEEFIDDVPYFRDVSYVAAYSSSQGFKDGLNAHVFFLLDEPTYYGELKALLTGINWFTESLRSAITLSDSRMALSRVLDTAGVRKASLIYLAPPIVSGGLVDPFPTIDARIFAVNKQYPTLSLSLFPEKWRDTAFFVHDMDEYLDELRSLLGLEAIRKRRGSRVEDGFDVEYLLIPPNTKVSKAPGPLHENGVVRCNVNNGDSGAYYFPFGLITDDTLMYNFKQEDPFLLTKADPDFTKAWNDWYIAQKRNALVLPEWLGNFIAEPPVEETDDDDDDDCEEYDEDAEEDWDDDLREPALLTVTEEALPSVIPPGRIHADGHFIFRDRLSDEHFEYRRRRDGTVSLSPLKLSSARTQAKVLGIKVNKEKGFPTLSLVHDVNDTRTLFEEHGEMFINTYAPPAVISLLADDKRDLSPEEATELMKTKAPAYYQTIHQAMGSDDKAVAHFINWLSVLFTKPDARVNTAWLLRGIHGSGKSSLVDTMLYMLVNYGRESVDDSVHVIDMALSISSFDDWRYGKKLILIDEVEVTSSQRTQGGQLVYNWYKTLVSTARATLNKKGSRLDNVKLNTGYIFASNYHDRFYVDPTERRYHVPPFQAKKMIEGVPIFASCSSWAEFKDKFVEKEIPIFGDILSRVQACERLAHTLYDCGDFKMIAEASKSVLDSFAGWMKAGNFDEMCANIFDAVDSDASLIEKPVVEHAMRYIAYVAATQGGDTNRIPTSITVSLYNTLAPASRITTSSLTRRLQQLGVSYLGSQRLVAGLQEAVGGAPITRCYLVEWAVDTDYDAVLDHPIIRRYVADMGVREGALYVAGKISKAIH